MKRLFALLVLAILGFGYAQTCEDGFRPVEHAGGETCIPEDPQRVALITDRHIGEVLVAVGIEPVAVVEKEFYPEFVQAEFSDFSAVTDLGENISEPNLEVLLEAEPDLIITYSDEYAGELDYDTVNQIAPTIQLSNPFEDARQLSIDIGAIFGEDKVAEAVALIDDAVEQITCAVDNPNEITVASIDVWQGQFRPQVASDHRTHALLLQEAGFTIPEQLQQYGFGNQPSLSIEEIQIVDTDVLFFIRWFLPNEDPEAFLDSPLWQSLDVVRNGNVIEGRYPHWSIGGPLSVQITADEIVAGLAEIGLAIPCEASQ